MLHNFNQSCHIYLPYKIFQCKINIFIQDCQYPSCVSNLLVKFSVSNWQHKIACNYLKHKKYNSCVIEHFSFSIKNRKNIVVPFVYMQASTVSLSDWQQIYNPFNGLYRCSWVSCWSHKSLTIYLNRVEADLLTWQKPFPLPEQCWQQICDSSSRVVSSSYICCIQRLLQN